jgi:hypothetical protein
MNVVELDEALSPGGKPLTKDALRTRVEELKAVHGADHIAALLDELGGY